MSNSADNASDFSSQRTDHVTMAAQVRKLGPGLCERLIAEKNRQPLKPLDSMYLLFTPCKDFERENVLELRDVFSALALKGGTYKVKAPFGSDFTAAERAVLEYLRDNFRRVGDQVGTLTAIGPRVATSQPYYAVSAGDLATYHGEDRNPGPNSSVVRDDVVDALLVGLGCGVLGLVFAAALMSMVPALEAGFVGYLLTIVFTVGGANIGFKLMRARPSK